MSPRITMRTQLALALALLLAVAATAPLASAICISRHEKFESKDTSEDAAEALSATEKTSESKKRKSSEDDDVAALSATEKKSESKKHKNSDDDAAERKPKSKSDASEDEEEDEKKSKSKSQHSQDDDDAAEKKSKSKSNASEDDDDAAAEKKSKSKSNASEDDDDAAKKKSKSKSQSSEDDDAAKKKSAKKKSKEDKPDDEESSPEKPATTVAKPKEEKSNGEAAPKKPTVNVQSISDMITKPVLGMLSPVIKTLCEKTDHPDLCESSIAKLPEAPPSQLDGVGVLKLAMNAVRAKIVEAKNKATDIMNDPGTDKLSKAAINDCLELYDDMNTNFDSAEAALKRGDKGTAGTMLDSARTDVDTCENGFLDRDGLKPLMADHDKVLSQLSSNVLAINAAVE